VAAIVQLHQASFSAKRPKSPPPRKGNSELRTREYLTPDEVERLIIAARHAGGRVAERDALLIMMAYRHGLRASEVVALRWDQIDLKTGHMHVAKSKNGSPSTHPLRGPELRALRALRRQQHENGSVRVNIAARWPDDDSNRALHRRPSGQGGGYRFPGASTHAPARHGFLSGECGHDTRAIQLYLGHKNIQHTVRCGIPS